MAFGAFGGGTFTEGAVEIVCESQPDLCFRMHVVQEGRGIPADGILGRDLIWGRTFIDTISKELIFIEEGVQLASLPMIMEDAANRICIARTTHIRPRSIQVVSIKITTTDEDVVIFKKEIKPGVYVGEVLTRAKNGQGLVPILNATEEEVIVDGNFELEYSGFSEFNEVDSCELGNINTITSSEDNVRISKLLEEISLDQSLSDTEKGSMHSIFKDFHDIFLLPGDSLSYTNVLRHEIPILPGTAPINVRQYRLPEAHKAEINRQVTEMLEQDIIVPSKSPWNSPIILVPKKAGVDGKKKWRLVVDFRQLNEQTVKTVFPIPRIDEILDQLGNSRYFTTLDLEKGYHQVLMDEVDREKTAFSTGVGHYEFKRMPFGLTGAPATFQRIMNCILTGLQGIDCFVYLDDIVVYGRDLEQHGERLRKVFQALRESNLKVNTKKCQFLRKEVVYLGHKCTRDGVLPDPS